MTPTPPSTSSFANFRFRRSRNTVPYDASNNATPTTQTPVTPLVDEGVEGDLEDDDVDADDDEEGAVEDEGSNIDEDGNDGEEDDEEGGIEEGLCCHSQSPTFMIIPTQYRP
jgi:hypothetical protein